MFGKEKSTKKASPKALPKKVSDNVEAATIIRDGLHEVATELHGISKSIACGLNKNDQALSSVGESIIISTDQFKTALGGLTEAVNNVGGCPVSFPLGDAISGAISSLVAKLGSINPSLIVPAPVLSPEMTIETPKNLSVTPVDSDKPEKA